VLNPAALALVVAGLAGIATPAWWAGSAGLLPFVLVAGVLVVRRLRRYAFVGVYLLVGGGLNLASSVAAGEAVPAAAWAVVASSPVLFLAAFMLTEPLTTPPRRWQALTVAAVVGVLDGVAFSVGPLHSSPELALLAGNALAFVFGQRRGVRLRVLRREPVGADTVELVLAPRAPLAFRPGQYLELCLPHPRPDARGTRRMFSIVSPPARADEIAVAMRLPERPSSFKRAVAELEPGRVLTATGVHGDFTPPADPDTPVLWVAGGIGITPFASMAAAGAARDAVLAYRVPDADDVPYAEVFEKAGTTVLLFAPAPPAAPPRGW
ncbi:FAD-dependent oxidoreductase, partial [Nocardiopsis protaetiae]